MKVKKAVSAGGPHVPKVIMRAIDGGWSKEEPTNAGSKEVRELWYAPLTAASDLCL